MLAVSHFAAAAFSIPPFAGTFFPALIFIYRHEQTAAIWPGSRLTLASTYPDFSWSAMCRIDLP